jgi:hypothetical protein
MTAGTAQVAQWSGAGPDLCSQGDSTDGGGAVTGSSTAHRSERGDTDPQLDWLDDHHHAVSSMLMQRGFVPLYPQLARACGSPKAALMLGQAVGLSRTWLQRDRSRNGWFWMTAADWQNATGLTAREQESARETLVASGLWEERRTHNPSRLYFRVHLATVAQALGLQQHSAAVDRTNKDSDAPDAWQWDAATATNVLGDSLMFFKPLADLAGDVMAGLLLSLLLAEQRKALRSRTLDEHGRFRVQFGSLVDEAVMGPKAIRNARERLRRAGFITEQAIGSGPVARLNVGVNLTAMMACLQDQPSTAMRDRIAQARLSLRGPDRQRPIPARARTMNVQPTIAGIRQSEGEQGAAQLSLIDAPFSVDQALTKTSGNLREQPVAGVPALLSIADRAGTGPSVPNVVALLSVADESACPFVECDPALLSVAYTENYKDRDTTTTAELSPTVTHSDVPGSGCSLEVQTATVPPAQTALGDEDLVVPAGIERQRALQVVRGIPLQLRQIVLDELAGNMLSKRKTVEAPLALLHFLAREATAGRLMPTRALDVRQVREARALAAAREATTQVATTSPGVETPAVTNTAPSEAATAAMERMRELRSQIASRGVGAGNDL